MDSHRMRRVIYAVLGGFGLLAVASLLPPAMQHTLHLCPLRPNGIQEAGALPAFSRKYGVSCAQCHYAFPVLNAYGRQFKMNGYVQGRGNDEGVLQSDDKKLWIERVFPWAAIIRSRPFDNGRGTISNQGTQMGGTQSPNPNGFKSEPLNDVDMFVAGGDASRMISYFGELDANSAGGFSPALGDLRFGWHPVEWANVILARRGFFADDPYQTIVSNESPTIAGRATDMVLADQGSISGSMALMTQQMGAVNGQLHLPGRNAFVYYAVGATKDNDTGKQAGNPTNGAVRLAFDNAAGLMVGGFGSYGHAGPFADCGSSSSASCPGLGYTDNVVKPQFVRGGFDALWEIGDFAARGAFVYAHDGLPGTAGASATDRGAYAELAYAYKRGDDNYPFLMPLVRENWYTTFNGAQEFNYMTFQLAHYFQPNLKAFAEYSLDNRRAFQGGTLPAQGMDGTLAMRGNRATLQIEVGF